MIPTSNHNFRLADTSTVSVVYLLIPTSNHNLTLTLRPISHVVYLLIPTSNHNCSRWGVLVILLYIFWFLHQTTTLGWQIPVQYRCISFDSYIKPQPEWQAVHCQTRCISFDSYIKPQLGWKPSALILRCISFDSYIKPQLSLSSCSRRICCISFDSYIKPQQQHLCSRYKLVVYLLIPTSNHNSACSLSLAIWVVYLLIPTSNHNIFCSLFIIGQLYIFWFLHQTTTDKDEVNHLKCCISFDSYIKPQHSMA